MADQDRPSVSHNTLNIRTPQQDNIPHSSTILQRACFYSVVDTTGRVASIIELYLIKILSHSLSSLILSPEGPV